MIQDRLTAKFQSAKPATRRVTGTVKTAKPAPAKKPAMDAYAKGRQLSASFWL